MSYILDALKKSEQQRRQHSAAPNLDTIHQGSDSQPEPASLRRWLFLLAVIIVLLLGYLGLQLNQPAPQATVTATAPITAPSPKPVRTERSPDAAASALYQPSASTNAGDSVNQLYAEPAAPVAQVTNQPSEGRLPAIHELPLALQSQIGHMDYSAHVYSSDASRGFAIINGKRRYREDRLENGLTVVTVLEEAVVMEFMGQLFLLEAMQSWPMAPQ